MLQQTYLPSTDLTDDLSTEDIPTKSWPPAKHKNPVLFNSNLHNVNCKCGYFVYHCALFSTDNGLFMKSHRILSDEALNIVDTVTSK